MECRPTFLGGFRDGLLASSTHLALRFCRGCFGRRFGFALGCSPTFPLCITDALPGGGTHIPALAFWNSGLGYRLSGATVQHGLEFGNLEVDPGLLRLESCYGGDDDFVREFCRHVNLSQPFTLTHFSRLGVPPRDTQFCVGLPFLPHSPALALTFAGSPNDGCPLQSGSRRRRPGSECRRWPRWLQTESPMPRSLKSFVAVGPSAAESSTETSVPIRVRRSSTNSSSRSSDAAW